MKVEVLHHNPLDFQPTRQGDIRRYYRNPNADLHPFQRAREYTRALVAVKLDKIFAKPLLAALDGHQDSVKCMARAHHALADLVSGSCDGEVRLWNLSDKKCHRAIRAHDGFVRGVCVSSDDRWIFSCGDDKKVKQWSFDKNASVDELEMNNVQDVGHLSISGDISNMQKTVKPTNTLSASSILTSIDHHYRRPLLVTSGDRVDVWDPNRSAPIHSFEWGCDVVYAVRFNHAEDGLLASTGADNSIGLYDMRSNSAIRKVILKNRSNGVCWNPQRPLCFTVANEDHNLYTFDMRKLNMAIGMHKDFTGPVLDVDYSPTGAEFVGASYDQTIRVFDANGGRSRDVYHTKRMQTVLCSLFSADAQFVMSGSADMCVRIWKAQASAPLGPRTYRERSALAYRETIKSKFGHLKEIHRIQRHHHVPRLVKKTAEKKRIMDEASKRKEDNRRKHAKPGAVPHTSVLKKPIVKELE